MVLPKIYQTKETMNLQDLTDDQKVGLLEQVMKKTQKYQKEYYQNVTKMKQH